jgi:hypothetical protein
MMERDEERPWSTANLLALATSQRFQHTGGPGFWGLWNTGFSPSSRTASQALECAFELHSALAQFNTEHVALRLAYALAFTSPM